ncbi:MAG: SUMF1/EgtB/PvdO family nonheme iron enzyme, partial [Pseudomonadota bacterium]
MSFGKFRDNVPATNISRSEAEIYLDWLSSEVGASCRLPSLNDWIVAGRGGAETPFHFGDVATFKD